MCRLTNVTTTSRTWGPEIPCTFEINKEWNKWTSPQCSIAMVGFQRRLYFRFLHRNALPGKAVASRRFLST